MKNTYSLTPKFVKKINTKYRRIITKIPPPGAISIIKKLRKYEPRSMSGHPLVVWDRAKGFQVYDKFGNKWIDFSSGILVANAGHCCSDIQNAIIKQVRKGLLHNYCFPSEIRAILVEKLVKLMPFPLRKVFLLSTGAEAVETIIKILRTYGFKTGGKRKIGIISFSGAFHGRTLGAQMIGGISDLKKWIVNFDKNMYVSPFPNCFRCPWGKDEYNKCEEECFNNSLEFLKQQGVVFSKIAGVLTETYQGAGATFIPKKFVQLLQKFCKKHKILLAFDEVQAGFGRTGKMFGFEHYGVVPDITCFGKGITS